MRLPFVFLLLPAAIALLVARAASSPLFHCVRPFATLPGTLSPTSFQTAALEAANRARANLSSPAPALASHPIAIAALEEFIQSGVESPDTFDRLFTTLQERRPQLHEIGSNLITASSQGELLAALASWPELTKRSYTHLATTVFRQPRSSQSVCLATVLDELPPLTLPAPRHDKITGYDTCPICNTGHGVTLSPQTQSTLSIRCPHCGNPYDLLAADSSGNWRRATQFLQGFDKFKAEPGLDPEALVLSIWKQMDERCRYQLDPERIGGEDSWNLPEQTYQLTWGDCEDTAILLADALISNGIEARVALGRMKGKGHAWCVVRLGERQFILESTAKGVSRLRYLPRMDDTALDYEPECLFDRETVCFNAHHQWTSNYWSGSTWVAVKHPPVSDDASSKQELAQPEPPSGTNAS